MDGKKSPQLAGSAPSPRRAAAWAERLESLRAREVPRLALWTPVAIGLGAAAAFSQAAAPGGPWSWSSSRS